MSAIAGIARLDDGLVNPDDVDAMLAIMGYRGTTLRLSTLGAACVGELSDVPGVAARSGTRHAVAADARIDNVFELTRALAVDDDGPTRALLLHAYETWGENFARRLLGDFALAVWDERRRQVVCIRDHFGVRPLYYWHVPGRIFAFASEVKALLTLPDLVVRIDETRIADFLAGHFTDMQHTFYEDVLRLPPAHILTVTPAGIMLRRYWAPDPSRTERCSSDAEYAAAFREIFAEAVRCRLEPFADLGITLSGGLDSSSVACMARHLLRNESRQLSTFSLLLGDAAYGDERPYIAAMTRSDDLSDDHIEVTERSPLRHLESVSFHCDGPGYGQLACDFWEMYSRAAERRVGVLLDGCDGDMTISYNFRYLGELAYRLHWVSVLREARSINRRYFSGKASSWWLLKNYCMPPLLPSWAWLWRTRRRLRAMAPERGPHSFITERFASRSGLTARMEIHRREMASIRKHRDRHAYILGHPLVPLSLESTDHLCAAFSIDHRHPFYDKRLVEFCLALPREQLVNDGWTRPILRRALADLLPPEVQRRGDKGGSVAPRRLAQFDRRVLEETAKDEEALGDYLDMDRLRASIESYLDGGVTADAEALWPAVSLRQWLRSAPPTASRPPHIHTSLDDLPLPQARQDLRRYV
jgi:asparagine synthase (glutamine-hydrolysing)